MSDKIRKKRKEEEEPEEIAEQTMKRTEVVCAR